jgi:hypothetical protein
MFDHACYLILENDKVLFIGNRKWNVYKVNINAYMRIESCLVTSININFLCHRKLGYISMDILSKLIKNELLKSLPHIAFKKVRIMWCLPNK